MLFLVAFAFKNKCAMATEWSQKTDLGFHYLVYKQSQKQVVALGFVAKRF